MKYREKYGLNDLENMTEEIVFEELFNYVETHGGADCPFCTCAVCVQDIAAILLNRVPPVYICNILEKIDPRDTLQKRMADVRQCVRDTLPEAIEMVTRFEHH